MSSNRIGCKVTVGMPAYNSARFIKFAIQSVLNQTYKDFELIITDDGSTDDTVAIAKSFNDPRITVLTDGKNRGISYRLNQQIDLAQGKYFVRMDSDDIMFPDRIEKQVTYLDANPDVSLVSSGMVVIDDDNNIIGIRPIIGSSECVDFTYEDWLSSKTIAHPTVTGRIEIFRAYRYNIDFSGVEDLCLWLMVSREHRIVMLNDLLMFYRDPLRFKLKTYWYRGSQRRKLLKYAAAEGLIPRKVASKQAIKGLVRLSIASIGHFLGMDNWMIARRNVPDKNLDTHRKILRMF